MTRASRARSRAGASTSVPSVLVVSSDPGLREQVAAWVDEAGYDVIMCPGPHPPDYRCIGLRGERCPLDAHADLTVLEPPSGGSGPGRPGRPGGRPVLVLADERTSEPQRKTAGAAFLERTAGRGALLASVADAQPAGPLGPPASSRYAKAYRQKTSNAASTASRAS